MTAPSEKAKGAERLKRLERAFPDADFDAYETIEGRWLAVLAMVDDLRRRLVRSERRCEVLEKRLLDVKAVAAGKMSPFEPAPSLDSPDDRIAVVGED